MIEKKQALVRVRHRYTARQWLTVGQAAERCAIHPDLLSRFVRLGLCDPLARDAEARHWFFAADVVPRVHRILRLRRDLGINYAGIGVVLDLLAHIEDLERRLEEKEAKRR